MMSSWKDVSNIPEYKHDKGRRVCIFLGQECLQRDGKGHAKRTDLCIYFQYSPLVGSWCINQQTYVWHQHRQPLEILFWCEGDLKLSQFMHEDTFRRYFYISFVNIRWRLSHKDVSYDNLCELSRKSVSDICRWLKALIMETLLLKNTFFQLRLLSFSWDC